MVRASGSRAVHAADQIGAGVDPHLQARLLETTPQPIAPFEEAGRERPPGIGPLRIGDGGERHQVVPQARLVDRRTRAAHRPAARRCACSAGAAAAGRTKVPLPGSASTVLAVKDHLASQEGRDRPIGQFDARIGTPAHEIVTACRRIIAPRVVRHHHQIGVAAGLDRTLAMADAEQPRRVGGKQTRRPGHIQLPFQQALEQQRVENFQPRHAGSVFQHIRIGLAVFRPADVIGRHHRDVAGSEMMPERLDLRARADRRIDLGLAAQPREVVLLVEREVMNARLDGGVEALLAIGGAEIVAASDRAMHDVSRASGVGRDLVDFHHRQRLRDAGTRQGVRAIIPDAGGLDRLDCGAHDSRRSRCARRRRDRARQWP